MDEQQELKLLSNEQLVDELYKYLDDMEGDEYYEQFISELNKRMAMLTEFQELAEVRKTW